jgi:hypothetical protein
MPFRSSTTKNWVYRIPARPVTLAPRLSVELRSLRLRDIGLCQMRRLRRFYRGMDWAILALRRLDRGTRLWCVLHDGELVHVSWTAMGRACRRYHFVPADGCLIGPCVTAASARGQGLYPWVLQCICAAPPAARGGFWVFNDEQNVVSGRGIVRAGGEMAGWFERCTSWWGMRARIDYTPTPGAGATS